MSESEKIEIGRADSIEELKDIINTVNDSSFAVLHPDDVPVALAQNFKVLSIYLVIPKVGHDHFAIWNKPRDAGCRDADHLMLLANKIISFMLHSLADLVGDDNTIQADLWGSLNDDIMNCLKNHSQVFLCARITPPPFYARKRRLQIMFSILSKPPVLTKKEKYFEPPVTYVE